MRGNFTNARVERGLEMGWMDEVTGAGVAIQLNS